MCVISHQQDYLLYLILNELKSPFDLIFVSLEAQALGQNLQPLMHPRLLFFPNLGIHFGLNLSFQAVGLSLHHEHEIINQLIIYFFILELLNLKSQVCNLALFLFELPLDDLVLILKKIVLIFEFDCLFLTLTKFLAYYFLNVL